MTIIANPIYDAVPLLVREVVFAANVYKIRIKTTLNRN